MNIEKAEKKVLNKIKRLKIIKALREFADERGVNVFIVGGFVRDAILERKCKEIDFLIIGENVEFARDFAKSLGAKNVSLFKTFGTAHFKYGRYELEFVSGRKESYRRDSRKPIVEIATFEEDISRRDFTINALAVGINSANFGRLIDLYNGVEDIAGGLIKTTLDPFKTFDDDPLRILRAFRFAAQLNFKVSDSVKLAARQMKDRLEIVSQERITAEFIKILESPKPSVGLKLLYETEVLNVIFPELARLGGVEQRKDFHHKDVFYHTCEVVDKIAEKTDNLWLRFAALLHDIAKPQTKRFKEGTGWTFHGHEEIGARMIKNIFRKMKLPLNKAPYVENLVRLHLRPIALVNEEVTDSAIRRLIVAAGDSLEDLFMLCRADITSKNKVKVSRYLNNYDIVTKKILEVQKKDELRKFQSPVSGNVIMEVCNIPPSRTVGLIKKEIEEAILDGKIQNTYEAAYEYLLKIKDRFIEKG